MIKLLLKQNNIELNLKDIYGRTALFTGGIQRSMLS